MNARDRLNAAERAEAQADTSAGPQDWKAQTVKDVATGNTANPVSAAEKAVRKSQIVAELEKVNAFLQSHLNFKTNTYDPPFDETEWCAASPDWRQRQLAVVNAVLAREELDKQARVAGMQQSTRRESVNHQNFWSRRDEEELQKRRREGRE